MAVYGVTVEHETPYDGTRGNRWWINAGDFNQALGFGETLASLQKEAFGSLNRFSNIHAWVPNATPNDFRNRAISMLGEYEALTPTNAVPCLQLNLSIDGASYPNAKYFRIGVNPQEQAGRFWGAGVLAAANAMAAAISLMDAVCGREGQGLVSVSVNPRVVYRQLSKKWYNREP